MGLYPKSETFFTVRQMVQSRPFSKRSGQLGHWCVVCRKPVISAYCTAVMMPVYNALPASPLLGVQGMQNPSSSLSQEVATSASTACRLGNCFRASTDTSFPEESTSTCVGTVCKPSLLTRFSPLSVTSTYAWTGVRKPTRSANSAAICRGHLLPRRLASGCPAGG